MPVQLHLRRLVFVIGAAALGSADAAAQDDDNTMEVVIAGGPHRGTYKLSPADVFCLHYKSREQFVAAYKDSTAVNAKVLNSAGINVWKPNEAGPKRGDVSVTFGEAKGKPIAEYSVSIPAESKGPLTMTKKGTLVQLSFQGTTKQGVPLRVSAACHSIEEF